MVCFLCKSGLFGEVRKKYFIIYNNDDDNNIYGYIKCITCVLIPNLLSLSYSMHYIDSVIYIKKDKPTSSNSLSTEEHVKTP